MAAPVAPVGIFVLGPVLAGEKNLMVDNMV